MHYNGHYHLQGFPLLLSVSSIVNVPGEWTLRREFLRLQTEDREGGREGGHGGGGIQQRQQVGFDFHCNLLNIAQ